MTPRDRARAVLRENIHAGCFDEHDMEAAIESAIRAAVEAEREACAKVAEARNVCNSKCDECRETQNVAAEIRAREEQA